MHLLRLVPHFRVFKMNEKFNEIGPRDQGQESRVCPVQKNMTQAVAGRRQESQQTKDMRPFSGGRTEAKTSENPLTPAVAC